MSDQGSKRAAGAPGPSEDRLLLVLIASNPAMLDTLITVLLDIGLGGATVIESKGMGSIIRSEMPIFAGLAAFIPEHTGSRVVLSVTTRAQSGRVFEFLDKELKPADRPVAFSVPIESCTGLRR